MKKKLKPGVVVAILVVVLIGVGVFGTFVLTRPPSGGTPVVVKPTNPDDPKFKPNPALHLGGGNS